VATSSLTREQNLWRWRILIATYLGYAGYYLARKVFSLCKTSLVASFGWDLQAVAHIWTVYLVAYMLGQFIISFIGRKYGPRLILLGGLAVSIGCNFVFGLANSYATFLVFMFINGLVQATGWPGAVGTVSQWLRKKEQGSYLGIWSTNYQLGTMLVAGLGGYLLDKYGWRWSFFGCNLATIGVWWLLYFWQRDKPEDVGLAPIVEKPTEDARAVRVSQSHQMSFREYLALAFHPVVLMMGASYFCVKFLRYALDSWLPAFLNMEGLGVADASYYSQVFTVAGFGGAIVTGFVLDRYFKGNWAALSCLLGLGMIGGYLAVIYLGTTPIAMALWFGIVGFMVYGPDTILCGVASVVVAGEANSVAVAGIVNGIGSIGPIVQEEVIGWLMRGDARTGIRNTNLLYLSMSVVFVCLMLVVWWRVRAAHKQHRIDDAAAAA
jgi:sugar phosphate permease